MDSVEDYYRRIVRVNFTDSTPISYSDMKGFVLTVGADDTFQPATVTMTCSDSVGNTYDIVHSDFGSLNPMMFEKSVATGINYLEENNSAAFLNATFYPLNLVNITASYLGDPASACIVYLLF